MGKLTNLFAPKYKLWEGFDINTYEKICGQLEQAGIWSQHFKTNQAVPKCSGNCGSCASKCNFSEDTPIWEKMGSGFSDDLLKPIGDRDVYVIYVTEKQKEDAKRCIFGTE